MSNLKFFFFAVLMAMSSVAMAQVVQVEFQNNHQTQYFVGTFHTTPVSGCPSTALTDFYHDIPDNTQYTGDLVIENGSNTTTIGDISGLSIKVWPSGATYVIDFCDGNPTPQLSGFDFIPVTSNGFPFTIISWSISGNTITIRIT